jgi:hypothetical protein
MEIDVPSMGVGKITPIDVKQVLGRAVRGGLCVKVNI